MIVDIRALGDAIERAAAEATVNELGVDSIWISATAQGACLRASLCLMRGHNPAEVADALDRFTDVTEEMAQQVRDRLTRRNGAL